MFRNQPDFRRWIVDGARALKQIDFFFGNCFDWLIVFGGGFFSNKRRSSLRPLASSISSNHLLKPRRGIAIDRFWSSMVFPLFASGSNRLHVHEIFTLSRLIWCLSVVSMWFQWRLRESAFYWLLAVTLHLMTVFCPGKRFASDDSTDFRLVTFAIGDSVRFPPSYFKHLIYYWVLLAALN